MQLHLFFKTTCGLVIITITKLSGNVYALGTLVNATLHGRWHYCLLSKEVKSFAQGRGASNR